LEIFLITLSCVFFFLFSRDLSPKSGAPPGINCNLIQSTSLVPGTLGKALWSVFLFFFLYSITRMFCFGQSDGQK
jgi:hypothetical protein